MATGDLVFETLALTLRRMDHDVKLNCLFLKGPYYSETFDPMSILSRAEAGAATSQVSVMTLAVIGVCRVGIS